jgi:hypothetical protein
MRYSSNTICLPESGPASNFHITAVGNCRYQLWQRMKLAKLQVLDSHADAFVNFKRSFSDFQDKGIFR